MRRFQRSHAIVDRGRGDGVLDFACDIGARKRAPIVPLRIKCLGIHLGEGKVITDTQQRFGQQDVKLGLQGVGCIGRGDLDRKLAQQRKVIVGRVEPVVITVRKRLQQLLLGRSTRPGGTKFATRIELAQVIAQCDVCALDGRHLGIHQRIEFCADGRGDAVGVGCCRDGCAQQRAGKPRRDDATHQSGCRRRHLVHTRIPYRASASYKGLYLNFWPPTVASYIRPPLATVKTAMPL